MRAALQRVTKGKVTIEGRVTGEIGYGLVILLGVGAGDTEAEVELMANKVANLRIFADGEGKFNLSAYIFHLSSQESRNSGNDK